MYQIRFVLQYARGKVRRALRNTVSADGWKQMWSEIESTSRLIDQGVQDRLGVRALETWRRVNDIETRAERIESLQQATLAAVQLRHLIVEPLSVLDEETYLPVRLVVVVDALDECLEQEEAKVLLEMLATLEHLHQVQLRLLITSRRDKHLVGGFERLPSVLYRPVLLDKVQTSTEKNGSTDDITFYLSYTLAKIAEKHGVSQNWIDEADVHKLSQKADGLFIYAATACRFLDAEDFADEEARLERLEQIFEDDGEVKGPQQKVDEIYLKVLSFPHLASSTKKTRKRVYSRTGTILGFLAVLFEPVSVSSLGVFVSLPKETLDDILRQLNSIVSVPQDEKSPLGLVHLSFRDFILNEERSKQLQFRIEETAMHRKVLRRCLDIMSSELFQDICKVILPAKLASEVPRRQIEQNIPQHLRYACRYWIDHLAKLDQDGRLENELQDNGEIHAFLKERFLYWLEAMSFIGETPTTITMINKLQGMINVSYIPLRVIR
ncbi:hypothetical protein NW754_001650 [Fusarium falciforme]|nr:hypothetical protein NW754_001650 [Fusarium falciforme]